MSLILIKFENFSRFANSIQFDLFILKNKGRCLLKLLFQIVSSSLSLLTSTHCGHISFDISTIILYSIIGRHDAAGMCLASRNFQ